MPTFLSPEEILERYKVLAGDRAPVIAQMKEALDVYNDDAKVPLPERHENEKPANPNILQMGADQMAMRMVSNTPDPWYPSVKPGQKKADEEARIRRLANLAWWEQNRMPLLLPRRARQLLVFACAPVVIRPSKELRGPKWSMRDPLSAFPAPTENPDDPTPPYCIFAITRTWDWIRRTYPDEARNLKRARNTRATDVFTLLEYNDENEISTLVLSHGTEGPAPAVGRPYSDGRNVVRTPSIERTLVGNQEIVPLVRRENRAGMCTAVVPGRITLGRPRGNYDGIIGKHLLMARLVALETIAVENDVFQDEWAMSSDPNVEPNILEYADGRAGKIGRITGGQIQTVKHPPGYMTNPQRDWLERVQRVEAGVPPDFGGEAGGNIRTGRRGEQVLSAAVDYTIQAGQQMLKASLEEEDRRGIAVDKAYFGDEPKSYFIEWNGASRQVDYTPNKHFTTDRHTVKFPFPGSDTNGLTVEVGQMRSLDILSAESAMDMHPAIVDPELERRRIAVEGIRRAVWMSIEQQTQAGAIPINDAARMAQLVIEGLSVEEAVMKAQREAQERQATSGPPGAPDGPVEPGAPEAQPGLAQPGAGAEAGSGFGPMPAGLEGLGDRMSALFRARMTA